MAHTVQCKRRDCGATLIVDGIFADDKELRETRWIHLDGDIFCPACAPQALADCLDRVMDRLQPEDR
jgi:hypothetical protein